MDRLTQQNPDQAATWSGFTRPAQSILRRGWAVVLVGLLCGLGILYVLNTQTIILSYDSLGYKLAGERLASGQGLDYPNPYNALAGPYFVPYAFNVHRPAHPDPYFNYPPGFPALLALAQVLTGSPLAPLYVVPLCAMIGLVACYATGALLYGHQTGALAALLLGLSPSYFLFGTDLWSDLPAAVLLLVGLALYVAAMRPDKRQAIKLVLAGLCFGYAIFMRYGALVAVAPLGLHWLLSSAGLRERLRTGISFFGALGLSLAATLIFNQIYYGTWLTGAYSPQHGWYPFPAFTLAYALPGKSGPGSFVAFGSSVLQNLPLALPMALLGLLYSRRWTAWLLTGTAAVTWLLYSVYYFPATGINARFILPVLPALCLAAAHGAVRLTAYARRWHVPAIVIPVLLIGSAAPGLLDAFHQTQVRAQGASEQVQFVRRIVEGSAPEAVFMSYEYNDPLIAHAQRSVLNYRRIPVSDANARRYRTEMLEPCLVKAVDTLLDADIPVYYVEDRAPSFWESLEILRRNYELEIVKREPNVHQVLRPLPNPGRDDLQCSP